MKHIKYFIQFLIILIFFIIFKILGLKFASYISSKIVSFIGPFFRSKNLIKSNKLDYLYEKSGSLFFNFTKCISGALDDMLINKYYISDYNTYSNPSLFFSFRYSKKIGKKNCGRQVSFVGIKSAQ